MISQSQQGNITILISMYECYWITQLSKRVIVQEDSDYTNNHANLFHLNSVQLFDIISARSFDLAKLKMRHSFCIPIELAL